MMIGSQVGEYILTLENCKTKYPEDESQTHNSNNYAKE